jgi:hypothetical protein
MFVFLFFFAAYIHFHFILLMPSMALTGNFDLPWRKIFTLRSRGKVDQRVLVCTVCMDSMGSPEMTMYVCYKNRGRKELLRIGNQVLTQWKLLIQVLH